ncbi:MAG: DUF6514 family protein [Oscillospiraceae bacterium]|jgi:hypothetical protein|nr:DUF6514 family protein [Oscillospiraceae bacterium]
MRAQLITRGYVCRDGEDGFTLEYSLTAADEEYGVKVAVYGDGFLIEERTEMLCGDRVFVESVIRRLAKGFVFPAHLTDVLEDTLSLRARRRERVNMFRAERVSGHG